MTPSWTWTRWLAALAHGIGFEHLEPARVEVEAEGHAHIRLVVHDQIARGSCAGRSRRGTVNSTGCSRRRSLFQRQGASVGLHDAAYQASPGRCPRARGEEGLEHPVQCLPARPARGRTRGAHPPAVLLQHDVDRRVGGLSCRIVEQVGEHLLEARGLDAPPPGRLGAKRRTTRPWLAGVSRHRPMVCSQEARAMGAGSGSLPGPPKSSSSLISDFSRSHLAHDDVEAVRASVPRVVSESRMSAARLHGREVAAHLVATPPSLVAHGRPRSIEMIAAAHLALRGDVRAGTARGLPWTARVSSCQQAGPRSQAALRSDRLTHSTASSWVSGRASVQPFRPEGSRRTTSLPVRSRIGAAQAVGPARH